ncbi:hypothetical protein OCK74_12320 [Chitinophagaceae bacterium LB-8]|uniref:Auto-transporter adhesin head GIN domain-containing protein n=1 Tax=Paraflavisolibacter caeni TaxID=2982496 RepID=A0A9X3BID9_9BACT|nr:hypothetical protein [Paraflavisolibacter caeni]MCU7549908.1 hypothetical protein [Paraflavisolibacter caeni]
MSKLSFLCILLMAVVSVSFTTPGSERPLLTLKAPPPAIAFTTNEFIDVSIEVPIPCAGDLVTLEGTLHLQMHVTINGNNIIVKEHFQPQGITGIGISGKKYQATGVTQDIFKGSLQNEQVSFTSINNFRIIGQGPGNNYLVHQTIHTTINANGEVTSEVDNSSVECK